MLRYSEPTSGGRVRGVIVMGKCEDQSEDYFWVTNCFGDFCGVKDFGEDCFGGQQKV